MPLKSQWTDHIKDKGSKEDFAKYILNSGALLDRLTDIINKFEQELSSSETSEDYSSPSWPYLQADRLGQLKAYRKIKLILDRGEGK